MTTDPIGSYTETATPLAVEPAQRQPGAGWRGVAWSTWNGSVTRLSVLMAAYASLVGLQTAIETWPVTWVTTVLLAFLLSTLLPIMHEAVHGHVAPTPRANHLVGRLAGTLLTVNYSLYQHYHLDHHARLGEPDDPELPVELNGVGDYLSFFTPRYLLLHFWKLAWQTATGRPPTFLDRSGGTASVMADVQLLVLWLTGVGAALVVAPAAVVFAYLLPLALAPAWIFFTTLPEHFPLDERRGPLTRTVTSSRLLSYLLWNTNYHVEHHRAPECPYWKLPEQAPAAGDARDVRSGSFTGFHAQVLMSLLRRTRHTG